MTNDVLRIEPCGCQVVRNDDGDDDKCGIHVEWCALHESAKEMLLRLRMAKEQADELHRALLRLQNQLRDIHALFKARGDQ